jgi:hypothetical protein
MPRTEPTSTGVYDPTIDKRTGKPKRISKRLQEAIRLIESGSVRTIKAASERTGLSYVYLSEALRKPHVTRVLSERKRLNLSAAALRGSQRALELVDSPSERTSIEATKLVLGIDGFHADTAPRVSVAIDVRAGYILDLRNPDEIARQESARMVDVTPTAAPEVQHSLSGPAAAALDSRPGGEPTSYQPDSRWANSVSAPAEPEPVVEDAFERARLRQQERERRGR